MKKRIGLLLVILVMAWALVACGGATTEEPAAGEETTGEETTGALPDLGGREITVALENAYLPFNYIDPATGEPAGWDYEAIGAICELLNCRPTFVESQWEGMIQAVADGQSDVVELLAHRLCGMAGNLEATAVVAALRRQGLLIRDCSQVPGLNDHSVRVAVRPRADNDRLLRALSVLLCKGGA